MRDWLQDKHDQMVITSISKNSKWLYNADNLKFNIAFDWLEMFYFRRYIRNNNMFLSLQSPFSILFYMLKSNFFSLPLNHGTYWSTMPLNT